MAQGDEIGLLNRFPGTIRRRLSAAEYHRMADAGILDPDERIELIEGEIVVMAPIRSPHAGAVSDRYTDVTSVRPGDVLEPAGLPGIRVSVAAVLG